MNWKKILTNIVVFGSGTFGTLYGATGSVKAAGVGSAVAIASNLGGLIQSPPQTPAQ